MEDLNLNKNILGIPNPEHHHCNLERYNAERRVFWFRIYHVEEPDNFLESLYVAFQQVIYYEGPLDWRGVNFEIAPEEENWALLQRISKESDNVEILSDYYQPTEEEIEDLYTNFTLYKVKTNNGMEVKLIARRLSKVPFSQLPDSYYAIRKHPDRE